MFTHIHITVSLCFVTIVSQYVVNKVGEWSGQWFIRVTRQPTTAPKVTRQLTRTLAASPLDKMSDNDHDDLLLPDLTDEQEINQKRS